MSQPKVACPSCGDYRSTVLTSRPIESGIYRRRQCRYCATRFSTEEVIRAYRVGRPKKSDREKKHHHP